MRFLVASDSHGKVSNLLDMCRRAHTLRFPADGLIFLGDGLSDLSYLSGVDLPILSVAGNCDFFSSGAEREGLCTFDGYRIFYAHGDRFSVKSGETRIVAYAASKGADIVLYGHTHLPSEHFYGAGEEIGGVVLQKEIRVLNPGSVGDSHGYGGAGYGVLELTSSGVLWNRVSFDL